MSENGISIIVPSYNGAELLKKYLPDLILECENYEGETEIIIVDDGSTDPECDEIAALSPGIKIIKKEKNEGFAKSANLGVLQAKYPYIFLLNNDTEVSEGILEKLIYPFSDKNVFAVQCNIVSNDEDNAVYINKFNVGWGGVSYSYEKYYGKRKIVPVGFASGGASVFDKNKFISLGLFDERFLPFYFEDLDISFKAGLFGYKIYLASEANVYHFYPGSTTNKYFNKHERNLFHKRNYFHFIFKYSQLYGYLIICYLYNLFYSFLKLLSGDRYFIAGYFAAIFKKNSDPGELLKGNNVLFLDAPIYPPGGGQRSLFYTVSGLKNYNPYVILNCGCEFKEDLKKEGIPVHVEEINKVNFIFKIWKIIWLINIINPRIIHCNSATSFPSFFWALIAKILKIPFVLHVRVVDKAAFKDDIIAYLSCKIIVISEAVKNKLPIKWHNKIVKIYNSVDFRDFKALTDKERLKNETGFFENEKIIGIFSRLVKWKGHGLFLGAARIIIDRGFKCKFLIVGDGEEYKNIKNKILELNLSDYTVMTGYRKNIADYMNICDIVVNPSIEPEPFGRVIIEAMSLFKPVIASDAGGPLEIIENGIDGVLCRPDAESISLNIIKLLENKEFLMNIAINAHKKAIENFDICRQIEKIENLYKEILNT